MKKLLTLLLLIPLFVCGQYPYIYNREALMYDGKILREHPFYPTDIAGCIIWYDASDFTTIAKDGANKVSAWKNKGTYVTTATQVTGSMQPTYSKNQINGLPALYFNGNNSLEMSPYYTIPRTNPYTFFVVCRVSDTTLNSLYAILGEYSSVLISRISASPYNSQSALIRNQPTNNDFVHIGNPTNYFIGSFTTTHYYPNTTYYKDGEVKPDIHSESSGTPNNFGCRWIGRRLSSAAYFKGYIAEIIIYTSILSTDNMKRVHKYLKKKYIL